MASFSKKLVYSWIYFSHALSWFIWRALAGWLFHWLNKWRSSLLKWNTTRCRTTEIHNVHCMWWLYFLLKMFHARKPILCHIVMQFLNILKMAHQDSTTLCSLAYFQKQQLPLQYRATRHCSRFLVTKDPASSHNTFHHKDSTETIFSMPSSLHCALSDTS